jgi:hypothetical protein
MTLGRHAVDFPTEAHPHSANAAKALTIGAMKRKAVEKYFFFVKELAVIT